MLTGVDEGINESFPAVVDSVRPIRVAVTDIAARSGITGDPLTDVSLAVCEAVTNVIKHAYPEQPGAVHLTVAVTGDEFWVLVADDGCGYQTPSRRPGLGLGLTLIARLSDDYVITERALGGTEVRMRFAIPPSGEMTSG